MAEETQFQQPAVAQQIQQPQQAPATFQDQPQKTHPELVNLAERPDILGEDALKRLGEQVIDEYKQDEESRDEWKRMQAEWVNLYYMKDKPKNPPWQGASDDSMPIVLEGCKQFSSRAFKEAFGSSGLVAAVPTGNITQEDRDRADRVSRYMSWQLETQDREYKINKRKLLDALPLHGSVFTKTFYDPIRKKNVVENVSALDLVVPYQYTGASVDDVERKTQIIWMPSYKGKYLASQEFFTEAPAEFFEVEQNEFKTNVDAAQGMQQPASYVSSRPSKIYEQHRYLDLDGDGIDEPYVVWVDAQTGKVIRLAIRYATNPFGTPTNYKQPLEMFTHYTYLENPNGFYGLGLGHMTGAMNKSINKMLRQSIDAATLQNLRPGFASKQAGLRKGNIEFELGKIVTIDGIADDIKKNIMFMDHPGPSDALIQLMTAVVERADRLNMVTDMLTGQPDKVLQPTTALSLVEQGLTQFTDVQIRMFSSIEQELQKIYRLNSLYTDDVVYFAVQDASNNVEQQTILRDDFKDDLQIRPSFDPKHSTEEIKIRRAQMEYENAMKNPLIVNSPEHLREATRRYYDALGTKNIDQILPTIEQIQQKQQAQQQAQQAQQEAQNQAMQQQMQIKAQELKIKDDANQIKAIDVQTDSTNKAIATESRAKIAREKLDFQEKKAALEFLAEDRNKDGGTDYTFMGNSIPKGNK